MKLFRMSGREIGRPLGVPLLVDVPGVVLLTTTNLAAALVLCWLVRPEWSVLSWIGVAIAVSLLLQISAVAHEYAHLLAARWCGQPTPSLLLGVFGGCLLLGEGELEPAPGPTALVVAAGPLATLGLWALFATLSGVLGTIWAGAALAAGITAALNLVLLALNLLPLEPLDGGRLLRSAERGWRGRAASRGAPLQATAPPPLG